MSHPGINAPDDDAATAVARAHGGGPRLPWYGLDATVQDAWVHGSPAVDRGYKRVYGVDVADVAALDALDLGRYDAIVSVSTFFLVGFPQGTPGPDADADASRALRLGAPELANLCGRLLKPDGLVCVATASSPPGGHPAAAAVETFARQDFAVLRHGCGGAVGMPHRIYSLNFYGSQDDLDAAALDAEARLLMEMGAISPSPDDPPFHVGDPPPFAIKSAVEHIKQSPWPRVFVDGGLNSPFWLLKNNRAEAQALLAASQRHQRERERERERESPPPPRPPTRPEVANDLQTDQTTGRTESTADENMSAYGHQIFRRPASPVTPELAHREPALECVSAPESN